MGAAHHILGSHRAELASALEGRARFPAALEVIGFEVRARAALGHTERTLLLAEEALTLPPGRDWDPAGGARTGVGGRRTGEHRPGRSGRADERDKCCTRVSRGYIFR